MSEDEMNDYLWDRSGDEDTELRTLERLLERYRHRQPPPLGPDDRDDTGEPEV